jgi:hypothetical protein
MQSPECAASDSRREQRDDFRLLLCGVDRLGDHLKWHVRCSVDEHHALGAGSENLVEPVRQRGEIPGFRVEHGVPSVDDPDNDDAPVVHPAVRIFRYLHGFALG